MNDQLHYRQQIWQVVSLIPRGRVASYGQIAELAGLPRRARLVGQVLSQLPQDSTLPWHRVINSRGEIALPANRGAVQQERLATEGVTMCSGRIDWSKHRWNP